MIAIQRPDAILLDMTFESGVSGLEICASVRSWSAIPILILSVASDNATKVRALNTGADDYLVKPFGVQELLARVRAVQRRLVPRVEMQSPIVEVFDLVIDLHGETVHKDGQQIQLTKQEYALLKLLALAEGRLVTHGTLITTIWPQDPDDSPQQRVTARNLVRRLREKLEDDPINPTYILTEANLGYRLALDDSAYNLSSIC